jgi:ElaB/YqjD/DUF883 family membrane-anchored ribosome-binding protein
MKGSTGMIYKKDEYVQEDQQDDRFPVKRIEVLDAVDGDDTRFVGSVALGMQTPMGVQQIPVNFEIEADDIEEAFENFEQHANPRIEETRKEVEKQIKQARQDAQNRIVRPDEMNLQDQQGNVIDFDNLKTD